MYYYFFMLSAALILYYAVMLIRYPHHWPSYLPVVPLILFMAYARVYGMAHRVWVGAFELGGATALMVIMTLAYHRIPFDRIMLGVNLFLTLGGIAFLFDNETLLRWYESSKGGPLFGCIGVVGLLTTFFTERGFIGVNSGTKEAVRYTSFLLLATTFAALVWSVSADSDGLLWAVIIPFVILTGVRKQLIEHLL
jgi:hypothetical protein